MLHKKPQVPEIHIFQKIKSDLGRVGPWTYKLAQNVYKNSAKLPPFYLSIPSIPSYFLYKPSCFVYIYLGCGGGGRGGMMAQTTTPKFDNENVPNSKIMFEFWGGGGGWGGMISQPPTTTPKLARKNL